MALDDPNILRSPNAQIKAVEAHGRPRDNNSEG